MSNAPLVINVPQESGPRTVPQRVIGVTIGVILGILLDVMIFTVGDSFPNVARSGWYRLLIGATLAVLSGWLLDLVLEVRPLTKFNNALKETCTAVNAARTDAEAKRAGLDSIYDAINRWFEFDQLPPTIDLNAPNDAGCCFAALHKEQLRVASIFRALLANNWANATYRDQIELAGVLSTLAVKRFWATSADSVSQFHARNHYYLEVLEDVGRKVPSTISSGIPCLARIFIGRAETFLSEVTGESQGAVLALYDWHLRWLSSIPCGAVGDEDEPLRFFMENRVSVGTFFDKHNVVGSPITDFMVVDDKLIYGRQGEALKQLRLAFSSTQEAIHSYCAVFADLWSESKTIGKMLDELLLLHEKEEELSEFKKQCEKRQSKLHIARQFGPLFRLYDQQHGNGFVRRSCEIIGASKGICFAVDRADHKAGSILAWRNDPSYLLFMDASKKAARNASIFQRLYIIDTKLKDDPDELLDFVMESVAANIDVGFCLAEAIGPATSVKYDTDFIIVDFGTEDAFGFELQDVAFKPEQLEWTKNLIAREWMHNYHNFFSRLWNGRAVTIDKGSKRSEVREKLRDVIAGGSE